MTKTPTAFASLFNKKIGCPSSQSLLDYNQSRNGTPRAQRIEAHLADCDFCNAELQLLSHHQNTLDEYSFAKLPFHLRSLAEHLLHTTAAPFQA